MAQGARVNVENFFELLGAPSDASFSWVAPPPQPAASERVISALQEKGVVIDRVWALNNWGCRCDIFDYSLRSFPMGDFSMLKAATFFTYGGPPYVWVDKLFRMGGESRPSLLLSFVSYELSGSMAYSVRQDETLEPVVSFANGFSDVQRLLDEKNFAYDALVGGPFDEPPAECRLNTKILPTKKMLHRG